MSEDVMQGLTLPFQTLKEMNRLYIRSVKQSISEYILLNSNERKRLNIPCTPAESAIERRVKFKFGET